jgi:hypothetical protein
MTRVSRVRRDGVDGIGLGQAAGPALPGAAPGRDLADSRLGGNQRDGDVPTPARGGLDTDPFDTVGGEQVDRLDVATSPVGERRGGQLDSVVVSALTPDRARCCSPAHIQQIRAGGLPHQAVRANLGRHRVTRSDYWLQKAVGRALMTTRSVGSSKRTPRP